jgi:hypothetical protein
VVTNYVFIAYLHKAKRDSSVVEHLLVLGMEARASCTLRKKLYNVFTLKRGFKLFLPQRHEKYLE